jgi:hypothetical protein
MILDPDNLGHSFVKIFAIEFAVLAILLVLLILI